MAPNQRVAFLLANDFEDSEFRIPYERLDAAGFVIDVIGPTEGEMLKGKKGQQRIKANRALDDAHAEDYVALVIPGGKSPEKLRRDPRVLDFVRNFDGTGKPLAAVCHGPQLLISAGLVKGRTLTAWPEVQEELRQAGANVEDREVVKDGNWITSRKPEDLNAFTDAIEQEISDRNDRMRAQQPAESGETHVDY
jgi:protease I